MCLYYPQSVLGGLYRCAKFGWNRQQSLKICEFQRYASLARKCLFTCSNLTTLDGREITSMNKVQYLGVYLISSKTFCCNYDFINKSFHRAFNAIYGKVGRLGSADVVIVTV